MKTGQQEVIDAGSDKAMFKGHTLAMVPLRARQSADQSASRKAGIPASARQVLALAAAQGGGSEPLGLTMRWTVDDSRPTLSCDPVTTRSEGPTETQAHEDAAVRSHCHQH